MHLILEALNKTGGKADGDAMIAGKLSLWTTSRVRGSISIGPRALSHLIPFMAALGAAPYRGGHRWGTPRLARDRAW
jgi:hypothetical protein